MQNDLQDALTAWQGGEVIAARTEELLARLRADEEFRKIFAEEIWVLSLTRVAQAPNPRWLALCDELGITPKSEEDTQLLLERNVMAGVERRPLQVVRSWWRLAALGTTALAAALAIFLAVQKPEPAPTAQPTIVVADPVPLAVVLQSSTEQVQDSMPEKGRELMSGSKLALESGNVTLLFRSGVILQAEGPVELDLLSINHVLCHRGRVRTKVPKGAEGFRVQVPQGHVTDLGTEMGVNVEEDGHTRLAVFEGLAEASLQLPDQDGMRTESVGARQAVEILPEMGEMRKSDMEDFLPPTELRLPDLIMLGNYADLVHRSSPQHYWRLNRATNGLVPNEISGGAALRLGQGVTLQPDKKGMVNAEIAENAAGPVLAGTEPWVAKRSGWAIEFWFVSRKSEQSSLAAFSEGDINPKHGFLVEYNSQDPVVERRRSLRFLMRWPVETRGGVNLYSKPTFLPYQWHHVVAQQQERHMELWVDGRLSGKGFADELPEEIRGMLLFGSATILAPVTHEPTSARRLSGRMAEIAVYDRMLSADEVRAHAAVGGKRPATP